MPSKRAASTPTIQQHWTLPAAATMGSSVKTKGILLELRARLAPKIRKFIDLSGIILVLQMPHDMEAEFKTLSASISDILVGIESLPIIPREIEDILSISTTERHRWLKDNRLQSAGTRTVRLRGRAKKITFHVFDPRRVEEILNEDLVASWREDDVLAKAERRRQAAWSRRLSRAQVRDDKPSAEQGERKDDDVRYELKGWAAFEKEGLLR